jgi:single-strand DNA-binding protein
MSINHITLMGAIVRGPEYRMTPNGVPTANFSVAVTRPPRTEGGPEITDYVRVVTWRGVADRVNESVKKGDLVTIEGRLSTRSYETQDGQRRKTIEVEASNVEKVNLGGHAARASAPDEGPELDEFDDFPAPAPAATRKAPAKQAPPPDDLDDEIPF